METILIFPEMKPWKRKEMNNLLDKADHLFTLLSHLALDENDFSTCVCVLI